MQLIKLVPLALVVAAAGPARADTQFVSKLQAYADSDHTTVISPIVQAAADVTSDTSVSLGYVADIVTSASVDIVSQASPITMHDTRHQVSTGLTHQLGDVSLRGNYSYSRENDYLSHTLGFGAALDLNDKMTNIAVGYGLSLNTVGRSNDANFAKPLDVHSLSLVLTQTISPRTIAQITYELGYAHGFQASVYRFVPVRANPDAAPEMWVAENDPEDRYRHAIVLGLNHAVGQGDSVQADYRVYHDTWGITSHTIGARYFWNVSKKLQIRLRERFYTQNAATFYQDNYTMVQKYMAFDRELSPLWSETIGAKLGYHFTPRLEGELKFDFFYYHYSDFLPLLSRTGTNAGLGLSLTY